MKKINKKFTCILLSVAVIFSVAFMQSTAADNPEQKYTYEKEVTVEIPMKSSSFAHVVTTSDGEYTTEEVTDVYGNNVLRFKTVKAGTFGNGYGNVWIPYENAETKAFFDPAKVKKVEIEAVYNTLYHTPSIGATMDLSSYMAAYSPGKQFAKSMILINAKDSKKSYASSQDYTKAVPEYDFSKLTTSTRIKTVTVPGDKQGVKGTAYQIDDGDAIEMYSYTNRTSAYGVYPSVLATGNSINYELYSMKITYTKKVDVTKQVEQFAKKYPTAVSIKSVADITESNAATAASETEKAIKEFNSFDADMQNILVSSGAYSEDNYKKYYEYAASLVNGVIKFGDVTSLVDTPKELVVKRQFADFTGKTITNNKYALPIGFRVSLNVPSEARPERSNYFDIAIHAKRDGDNVVSDFGYGTTEIFGAGYNKTSTEWLRKDINPNSNPNLVLGTYNGEDYTPNTLTFTLKYVLNSAKTYYDLNVTISDGANTVSVNGINIGLNVNAVDKSVKLSTHMYNAKGEYLNVNVPTEATGTVVSEEYHLNSYGLTKPVVQGARFTDTKDAPNVMFEVNYDTEQSLPEGYTPVSYGACFIPTDQLNAPYEIIGSDYKGKNDTAVTVSKKAVNDGKIPAKYYAALRGSSEDIDAENILNTDYAVVAFVQYSDANGNIVTVNSFNDRKDTRIDKGQGNRSVISVAKLVATDIIGAAEESGSGIDTAEIKEIISVGDFSESTTRDKLFNFIFDNKAVLNSGN